MSECANTDCEHIEFAHDSFDLMYRPCLVAGCVCPDFEWPERD